jgi:hypothetical protein
MYLKLEIMHSQIINITGRQLKGILHILFIGTFRRK